MPTKYDDLLARVDAAEVERDHYERRLKQAARAVLEVADAMEHAADRDERGGGHPVTRFDARNWAENLRLAAAVAVDG